MMNPLSVSVEVVETERRLKLAYVISTPSTKDLARRITASSEYDGHIKEHPIQWKEFEDGLPNIFIDNVHLLRNREVVFLGDFTDPRQFFNQLSVLMQLPGYLVRDLLLVMPYFPTGTMERVDTEGQIATAHTFARLLSCLPLASRGPIKVLIFDIHALQERFYFGETIIPILGTAIPIFRQILHQKHAGEDIAIAFPDEGAQKRFGRYFADRPEWEQIICAKVRRGDERIVTVKEGNPVGKHCFIVDDLVKTGGTLITCKDVLLEAGAAHVSAWVTHAVFPLESYKRFKGEGPGSWRCFYTTDSCPNMARTLEHHGKPFEVLSIAPLVGNEIMRM